MKINLNNEKEITKECTKKKFHFSFSIGNGLLKDIIKTIFGL